MQHDLHVGPWAGGPARHRYPPGQRTAQAFGCSSRSQSSAGIPVSCAFTVLKDNTKSKAGGQPCFSVICTLFDESAGQGNVACCVPWQHNRAGMGCFQYKPLSKPERLSLPVCMLQPFQIPLAAWPTEHPITKTTLSGTQCFSVCALEPRSLLQVACGGYQTLAVCEHDTQQQEAAERQRGYKQRMMQWFGNKPTGSAELVDVSHHSSNSGVAGSMGSGPDLLRNSGNGPLTIVSYASGVGTSDDCSAEFCHHSSCTEHASEGHGCSH